MKKLSKTLLALAVAAPAMAYASAPIATNELTFSEQWSYSHIGDDDGEGGSEINAYDAGSDRVFVTNAAQNRLDIINGTTGESLGSIDLPGGPNSVAVKNGMVAVAVENHWSKQNSGTVEFYQASTGAHLKSVTVGSLPDMLTFTPDGNKIVVANEGEPNKSYTVDPIGKVSIIDISAGLNNATLSDAGFGAFDKATLKADGVRIFGPNASVAQDLEPEYVAVNKAGTKALVTLQENNAVAVVNLETNKVEAIKALGEKDYSLPGNEIDPSDKDGIAGNFQSVPVKSLYQPDAITSFSKDGKDYYVTANEGDARDYDGYSEEKRLGKINVDPVLAAQLETEYGADWADKDKLGRLKITLADSDTDGDGDIDRVVGYGARSFAILDDQGNIVYDSANMLDKIAVAEGTYPDNRSDDKGTEPEAVITATIGGKLYLFIGEERSNDITVFNLDDIMDPIYVAKLHIDDFSPEGLTFFEKGGVNYLLASDEYRSRTKLFEVSQVPVPAAAWLFGSALLGLVGLRRRKA